MEFARPILVTGCPRSGTTWVGSTLAASSEVFYIYEPFNRDAAHHLKLAERYVYLVPGDGERYAGVVASLAKLGSLRHRVLLGARGALRGPGIRQDLPAVLALRELIRFPGRFLRATRICLKDPLAFFAAEWLAATFDMQVIVLLRHPAGVISSHLKLGWSHELGSMLRQAALRRRFAGDLSDEIARFERTPEDELGSLILQWKLFAHAALQLREAHPDWLFVTHESLCERPLDQFEAIYQHVGLRWTRRVAETIERDTAPGNPIDPAEHRQHMLRRESRSIVDTWRQRLDSASLQRIEREAGPVWRQLSTIVHQHQPWRVPSGLTRPAFET